MAEIWDTVRTFIDNHGFTTIFMLVLANFVLGVSRALRQDEFEWPRVKDVWAKYGLPIVVFVVVDVLIRDEATRDIIFSTLTLGLTTEIYRKIAEVFPSVPTPATIKRKEG